MDLLGPTGFGLYKSLLVLLLVLHRVLKMPMRMKTSVVLTMSAYVSQDLLCVWHEGRRCLVHFALVATSTAALILVVEVGDVALACIGSISRVSVGFVVTAANRWPRWFHLRFSWPRLSHAASWMSAISSRLFVPQICNADRFHPQELSCVLLLALSGTFCLAHDRCSRSCGTPCTSLEGV